MDPAISRDTRIIFRHAMFHKYLGIVDISVGSFVFALEIIGFFTLIDRFIFGTGVFVGGLMIAMGVLLVLAVKRSSRNYLVAAFTLQCLLLPVSIIGIGTSSAEVQSRSMCWLWGCYDTNSSVYRFNHAKASIIVFVCCAEFVCGIVHVCLFSHELCQCCQTPAAAQPNQMSQPNSATQIIIQTNGSMGATAGQSTVILPSTPGSYVFSTQLQPTFPTYQAPGYLPPSKEAYAPPPYEGIA